MPFSRKQGIPFKTVINISDQHNYLQIISDLLAIHMILTFFEMPKYFDCFLLCRQPLTDWFPIIYFMLSAVSFQKTNFRWICALYNM